MNNLQEKLEKITAFSLIVVGISSILSGVSFRYMAEGSNVRLGGFLLLLMGSVILYNNYKRNRNHKGE